MNEKLTFFVSFELQTQWTAEFQWAPSLTLVTHHPHIFWYVDTSFFNPVFQTLPMYLKYVSTGNNNENYLAM